MLEGMPAPRDLRLHRAGGRCVITVGSTVLFDYDAADTVMRNMAISALRRLGFPGRRVAAMLGLTDSYVATLHRAALREGSAALIRHARPGRPSKLAEPDWAERPPGAIRGCRTRRSAGGWGWRTPRSAAASARGRRSRAAGHRPPGRRFPAPAGTPRPPARAGAGAGRGRLAGPAGRRARGRAGPGFRRGPGRRRGRGAGRAAGAPGGPGPGGGGGGADR